MTTKIVQSPFPGLQGKLIHNSALLENIRLGRTGLAGTNTLAYLSGDEIQSLIEHDQAARIEVAVPTAGLRMTFCQMRQFVYNFCVPRHSAY
jgi:hypothetical protein